MSDFPEPVGMSASVSRPAIAARTTSSCPGRKASKPKSSRSGVRRSLRRASIGSASGGSVLDFATTSGPAALERASSSSRGSPSSGTIVPVAGLVGVPCGRRCEAPSGRSSVPTATDTYSESGDRQKETRSALATEAAPQVTIAFRALDPAKRIVRRRRCPRPWSPRRPRGARSSAGTRRSGRSRRRASARAPRR